MKLMNEIDWPEIPSRIKYLVKEDNWIGMIIGFEDEPQIIKDEWKSDSFSEYILNDEIEAYFENIDWKKSKTMRLDNDN